jgi:hypothetical protein
VQRPRVAARKVSGPEPWIGGLYYAIASYMILIGVVHIVLDAQRLASLPRPVPNTVSDYFYFLFALGVFQMSLGLGLILKWEWARAVVKVFCYIAIFFAGLSLMLSFGAVALGSISGGARIFFSILDIVAWGTLLWLLSVTDEWS